MGAQKLPLWRTVNDAYRAVIFNIPEVLRISWLWLIWMFVIAAVFSWISWPISSDVDARLASETRNAPLSALDRMTSLGLPLADQLLQLPFLSSLAVAWHRFLLRGEAVHEPYYARLDKTVWGYAAFAAMLTIVPYVLTLPIAMGAFFTGGVRVLLNLAAVPLIVFFLVMSARLSVGLPAIALNQDANWRLVWGVTHGNTWRLIFGLLVCAVPFILIMLPLTSLAPTGNRLLSGLVAGAKSTLYALLVFLGVGFLSFAYRHFFMLPDLGMAGLERVPDRAATRTGRAARPWPR